MWASRYFGGVLFVSGGDVVDPLGDCSGDGAVRSGGTVLGEGDVSAGGVAGLSGLGEVDCCFVQEERSANALRQPNRMMRCMDHLTV